MLSKKRDLVRPEEFKGFNSAGITENTPVEIKELVDDNYFIRDENHFGFSHYPRLKGQSRRYLREMCLIYLVSLLESFFQDLYKQTAQLSSLSMDDVYLEKGGSLDRVCEAYKNTFNISVGSLNEYERFREIFDRRHLVTHSSGLVSDKYRTSYDKLFKGEDKLKKAILITPAYLLGSIELSLKFATSLMALIASQYDLKF